MIMLDTVKGTKSIWINGISEVHPHSSRTLLKKWMEYLVTEKDTMCQIITPEKIGIPLEFEWKIVILGAMLDNLLQHNVNTNANNNIKTYN